MLYLFLVFIHFCHTFTLASWKYQGSSRIMYGQVIGKEKVVVWLVLVSIRIFFHSSISSFKLEI